MTDVPGWGGGVVGEPDPRGYEPLGAGSSRAPFTPRPDPEVLEELKSTPERVREGLRERAKHDRYFLAKGVLGYHDVNPFTHGPLCRALEDRSRKRRMFLMPRGHLKTTLATITDCVGDALTDPDNCRILIVNEIEQNATGFLAEIKAHFESNEILYQLFPELRPERITGPGSRWSSDRACLPRSTSYKEWTWTAAGVGKALASNHYTKIKCDDLIGFEARESPAEMRYAIQFAKALPPLLISMEEDIIDFVGTRWAMNDLYAWALEAFGEKLAYFAREDIEVGPDGLPHPIFPVGADGKTKFSLESLAELEAIDPVLYYAQYKNNPTAEGTKDFNSSSVRFFDFAANGDVVYREDDGALTRWSRSALDVVMAVDPNSGQKTAKDPAGIVVSAQSPKDQIFVLDSWSGRDNPDAFVQRIFDMHKRWRPRVVGIEKAGQQTTQFYFDKLAAERKEWMPTQTLEPKNRDKDRRIRHAMQPIINRGRLYLHKSQEKLLRQIKLFPDTEDKSEIDPLAYGVEEGMWSSILGGKFQEDEEDAAEKLVSGPRRSSRTGYGR